MSVACGGYRRFTNCHYYYYCFFSFLFFFLFGAPFGDPGGPGLPKPSQDTPLPLCSLYPPVYLWLLFFFVLSSRKFQHLLQKFESCGRCCLLTFLPNFFDFPLVKHPPMPCRLVLYVSKTFSFLMPLLCWTQTIFTYSSYVRVGRGAANTEWRHIQGAPNRQRKGKNI